MPQDPKSGVYYELHGQGTPLLLGFPVMASHAAIFGEAQRVVQRRFLEPLTDRYRVLLVDYPSIGQSRSIPPSELSADRACADLLAVADAAGFNRFAYWGYAWGAAVGLQLATRSDRITALVVGGWTPLGGQYEDMMRAALVHVDDPPAYARVMLRSPAQYAQWANFWRTLKDWPEASETPRIRCPRMAFAGANADADVNAHGVGIRYASALRTRRTELEALGWQVLLIEGHGHGVGLDPSVVVPPVRDFLDGALPVKTAARPPFADTLSASFACSIP